MKDLSQIVVRQFCIASILFLILSGIFYLKVNNSTLDLQVQDTYYVVAQFELLILFSLVLGCFALVYYLTSKIFKRKLNKTLSQIHFWMTTLGLLFFIVPMSNLSVAGMPRRYYSFDSTDEINNYLVSNRIMTIVAILVVLGQCVFLINLVFSLFRKHDNEG